MIGLSVGCYPGMSTGGHILQQHQWGGGHSIKYLTNIQRYAGKKRQSFSIELWFEPINLLCYKYTLIAKFVNDCHQQKFNNSLGQLVSDWMSVTIKTPNKGEPPVVYCTPGWSCKCCSPLKSLIGHGTWMFSITRASKEAAVYYSSTFCGHTLWLFLPSLPKLSNVCIFHTHAYDQNVVMDASP